MFLCQREGLTCWHYWVREWFGWLWCRSQHRWQQLFFKLAELTTLHIQGMCKQSVTTNRWLRSFSTNGTLVKMQEKRQETYVNRNQRRSWRQHWWSRQSRSPEQSVKDKSLFFKGQVIIIHLLILVHRPGLSRWSSSLRNFKRWQSSSWRDSAAADLNMHSFEPAPMRFGSLILNVYVDVSFAAGEAQTDQG